MHNISLLRDNPDVFDAAMKRRGVDVSAADLLSLDEKKRSLQTDLQHLQQERNSKSKLIGAAKAKGEDAQSIMDEVAAIKAKMSEIEAQLEHDELPARLAELPNILDTAVPDGADEADNQLLREWGSLPDFNFAPKQHFELGEESGLMDFETATKMSGARFVVLSGALARLERALASFSMDFLREEFGYLDVSVPLLVRDEAMFGADKLPKFAEDSFQTTNGYWLIPTSEVSLVNLAAQHILPEAQLPMRVMAYTPCFRSEAGSAGRDTRGMIRHHQFYKVEMVSITAPEDSASEHEHKLAASEALLQKLGLAHRVMLLCAGDTGFGARKTYDLEVWLPGQNAYREIASISNCGDFQARRMKARFRPHGQDKGAEFVHTLNGTGMSVNRAIVAIIENYQQADGSIMIPDVLRPYMGGMEKIECVS